jgi:dynein heavy chain
MLNDWQNALSSLQDDEVPILIGCMKSVEKVFSDGATYLNWNSLGVHEFLERCKHAIHSFKSSANAVSSNVSKINKTIHWIGDCITLPTQYSSDSLAELQIDLQKFQEQKQKEILSQYHDIPPQLRIIEGNAKSVFSEKTSGDQTSKQYNEIQNSLKKYYVLWESRCLNAFTRSTLLSFFQMTILMKNPLFKIETRLAPPKLIYNPTIDNINKAFLKITKTILNTTSVCYQWIEGTCSLPSKSQTAADSDEPVKSFGERVVKCAKIQELNQQVLSDITSTWQEIEERSQRYLSFQPLWADDRKTIVEQFKAQNPTITQFDERLSYYKSLAEEIRQLATIVNINFASVNFQPVVDSIQLA